MKKGILKVRKTKKGKIFVQIDKQNGKSPMPLSYVSFNNTDFNDKECTYETDKKGIFTSISIGGKIVWSRQEKKAKQSQKRNQSSGRRKNKASQGFTDSFDLGSTLLPKDIRGLTNVLRDIDNFSLKFKKAARYELNHRGDKYKFWFFKNDYRTKSKFEIVANYGHIDFRAIIERQNRQVEASFSNNNRRITTKLNWRMVIGLGGQSVYETNMTLHPVYGIPYVPSSSIKGVLRSWIISQLFDNSEIKAIKESKIFCTLFGCPKEVKDGKKKHPSALGCENKGSLRFFDAFPNKAPKVKTDIMTVHYKDWYKETGYKPPTDTQMPNPIPFLTIENDPDLDFIFNIGITANQQVKLFGDSIEPYIKIHKNLNPDSTTLDIVEYWLQHALSDHGIGAKTAVGYGYFE